MKQNTPLHVFSAQAGEPFALRNLRLPQGTVPTADLPPAGDGLLAADLVIADGRIAWLGPPAR